VCKKLRISQQPSSQIAKIIKYVIEKIFPKRRRFTPICGVLKRTIKILEEEGKITG